VRYCDDFVVLCRARAQADEAYRRLGLIMERLSLRLHLDKTRTASRRARSSRMTPRLTR
jgi:hypothetical protein